VLRLPETRALTLRVLHFFSNNQNKNYTFPHILSNLFNIKARRFGTIVLKSHPTVKKVVHQHRSAAKSVKQVQPDNIFHPQTIFDIVMSFSPAASTCA
jgi:hypothetical protein